VEQECSIKQILFRGLGADEEHFFLVVLVGLVFVVFVFKNIPNEVTGVSYDQIAFFKTFRGTIEVCAR